jgi:hypothetical protein
MDVWTEKDVDLVVRGFIKLWADHMGLGFIGAHGGRVVEPPGDDP